MVVVTHTHTHTQWQSYTNLRSSTQIQKTKQKNSFLDHLMLINMQFIGDTDSDDELGKMVIL